MNRRNKILLLSAVATFEATLPWGSAGIAADNTVVLSPGSGVTMRSKDIGAGVQSPVNILGDLAGNPLYITNANSGVANGSTNVPTVSYNFGFNGTTWDQLQVDGNKLLKVTQGGFLWTVGGTVTANQGTPPWVVTGTVSTSPTGTQAVSGTLGVTQATTPWTVTGTVTQGGAPWTVAGTVQVGNFPALQTVGGTVVANQGGAPWTMTGTVQVGNFPALQTVGGTVVANQGGSPWTVTGTVSQNATWNFNCLSGCGGSVTVGNVGIATWANGTLGPMSTFGGTVGSILVPSFNSWVVGGTLAASQVGVWSFNCNSGCGGSVSVGNVGINTWANGTLGPMSVFGGTVGSILVPSFNAWLVGGTVTAIAAGNQLVSGTVNVGNLPAIQTVSGTVTQGGAPWSVSGTLGATQAGAPWTVTGTVQVGNFPALQTVGGTVVANQGGAPWTVAGTVTALPTGTQVVSGTLGATQAGAPWTMTGTVQVGNFPAIQTVAGTVTGSFTCISGCGGSVTVGNVGIATWANGTLGPMSTFGGTVGSILVPSFNAWLVGGTVSVANTNPNITVSGTVPPSTGASPVLGFNYGYNGTNWEQLVSTGGAMEVSLITGSISGATGFSALALGTATGVAVKANPGVLFGAQLGGTGASPAYLKIYNGTGAVCGSGTPIKRLIIPAAATAANGAGSNILFGEAGILMNVGISYCVTTGILDTDTTPPPPNSFLINLDYK